MFNAVKNYISPSKVEEGTDKPTVIVDPPKTPDGAKGGSLKKSDLNTDPDDFHSMTPSDSSQIVRDSSTYGPLYENEADPELRQHYKDEATSRDQVKRAVAKSMANQVLLGVPTAGKKGGITVHKTETINYMEQQIRDLQLKIAEESKKQTVLKGSLLDVGVQVDTALAPVLSQLRKTLGTGKANLTRLLNDLERRQGDRKFLDTVHKRLEDGMVRLQENTEAFMAVPGITEAERQGLIGDFNRFDASVTHAKNYATAQLSMLEASGPQGT